MDDSAYSVRVDRAQGLIEISGPDKDWIAEQLAILMPILTAEASSSRPKQAKEASSQDTNSGEKARKQSTRSRRSSSSSGKTNPDLAAKLSNEMKTNLQTYLDERSKKARNAQGQAAVIATFLMDELDWAEITADDLYTVYSEMGLKIPATRNALSNAQLRKGYFSAPTDGKYRVSHKGQNFARHDSKES